MNDLMTIMRISSFDQLLGAYKAAHIDLGCAIDGGAGCGETSKRMLSLLTGKIFAFEPFPGNHRFFHSLDSRIQLFRNALAEGAGERDFAVSSVVEKNSDWGRRGMEGYSSVGKLMTDGRYPSIKVECVAADDVLREKIGFIKLDLQGGELNALKGMPRLLSGVQLMWVEYMGDESLISFLRDSGFVVFDTEYLFLGTPSPEACEFFDVSRRDYALSTGRLAWFGFRRRAWGNYDLRFSQFKKQFKMVQTDLVCVARPFVKDFIKAINHLT